MKLIQIAGAEARADKAHRMANPFFMATNSPPHSKDTPAEWRAKKDAWDRGYREGLPFAPVPEEDAAATLDKDPLE